MCPGCRFGCGVEERCGRRFWPEVIANAGFMKLVGGLGPEFAGLTGGHFAGTGWGDGAVVEQHRSAIAVFRERVGELLP